MPTIACVHLILQRVAAVRAPSLPGRAGGGAGGRRARPRGGARTLAA